MCQNLACGTWAWSGNCQNFKALTVKSLSTRSLQAGQHDPRAVMRDSPWGWLNKVQQSSSSDRTLWWKPDSETVPEWFSEVKQTQWLKHITWLQYTELKKEKGEVLQPKLNWLHFTHAAMPETKLLLIQSGIQSPLQVWMFPWAEFQTNGE